MTPKQKIALQEKLLVAARELFSRKGFAATSTREIAAQAGCNLSLISYYFGSKEGLLAALIKAEMEDGALDFLGVLQEPGSAAEQLARFIERAIDHFAEDGEILRIAHRELIHHNGPFLSVLISSIER